MYKVEEDNVYDGKFHSGIKKTERCLRQDVEQAATCSIETRGMRHGTWYIGKDSRRDEGRGADKATGWVIPPKKRMEMSMAGRLRV